MNPEEKELNEQIKPEDKRKLFFKQFFTMLRLVVIYFGFYFGIIMSTGANPKWSPYIQYFGIGACFVAGFITWASFPKGLCGYRIKTGALTIPGIILFSLGITVLLNVLFTVIPWEKFLPEQLIYSSDGLLEIPFWITVIGYGIIGPAAEEICFRGVLFSSFRKWMKVPFAIALSAAIFALYHGNIVQGLYALIMGALMAYLMYQTDSLFASMLFHMAANMIVCTYSHFTPLADFFMSVPGILLSAALMAAGAVLLGISFRGSAKSVKNQTEKESTE